MSVRAGEPGTLLLVDDDTTFCEVLGKALERRGYRVQRAHCVEAALPLIQSQPSDCAVFDLKLGSKSGLALVDALHRIRPDARIVVLSGYASVATAVDAVRLGAMHVLSKPANADDVVAAFSHKPIPDNQLAVPRPYSPRQEAEYLVRVLDEHHGNISQAARTLNMHRRTLQRKLTRMTPRAN
ncbi:MAG: response regulator [Gallionella sp.]